jgi:hypothetical protein
LISTIFGNIIVHFIYKKKFSDKDYGKMNSSEKKLFDDAFTFAKLDEAENIKIFSHK